MRCGSSLICRRRWPIAPALSSRSAICRWLEHYGKARAHRAGTGSGIARAGAAVDHLRQVVRGLNNCQRAVRNDPRSVEALTILAQCVAHQGKTEEAIEFYDRALAMQPDNEGAITRKIFALDFDPRAEFPEHQQVRKEWWTQIGSKVPKIPAERLQNVCDPDRRLTGGLCVGRFQGSFRGIGVRTGAAQP